MLDRLVKDKLATIASEVSAEGWKWVATAPDVDHEGLSRFVRRYPERIDLSEADQAEHDALADEYDNLVDSGNEDNVERLAAIEQLKLVVVKSTSAAYAIARAARAFWAAGSRRA